MSDWLLKSDWLLNHLLSGARLPLEDGLCCLVVLVRHGAGERRHALAVADAQSDVRVGDEQLDDDVVLVANGGVDGSSALRVLTSHTHRYSELTCSRDTCPNVGLETLQRWD